MSERKQIEINDDQLYKDLNAIANSDEDSATLKVNALRAKYVLERTEYIEKLKLTEGTVAEREARAKTSDEYQKKEEEYLKAVQADEVMKAKRASAFIRIDVWRSKNANRRTGNI